MAKTSAVNATASGAWQYGNAAADAFAKEDVQNLGANFDLHDHSSTKGKTVSVSQRTGPTVGTTNGPTYAVTSFATIPEMSVTLTTTGGELDVDMIVAITHSTTSMASFYGFSLDGAAEVGQTIGTILGAAGDHQLIHLFWTFSGVGAGSHTVTGRWKVGSDTVTAAGTQRWIRLIERKS